VKGCGNGFFSFLVPFQEALKEECIKFIPNRFNRTGAPHLNGKVERSQQTDKVGFLPTVDRSKPVEKLQDDLGFWQMYYNGYRPHAALDEKVPLNR
jgi:transposase InsO family protein